MQRILLAISFALLGVLFSPSFVVPISAQENRHNLIIKFTDESLTPDAVKQEAAAVEKRKNENIFGMMEFYWGNLTNENDPIKLREQILKTEKDSNVIKQSSLFQQKPGIRAQATQDELTTLWTIQTGTTTSLEETIQAYEALPNVEWAIEDLPVELFEIAPRYQFTNRDTDFSKQWALDQTPNAAGEANNDIDAPEAWNITLGSSNVTVAVIDSGIERRHVDLAPNVFVNTAENPNNTIDDDNNGYVNDIYGWNFIQNNNDTFDNDGHGTHVSGIIAAKMNNGAGIAGVSQSKILPLRIFTDGGVDEKTSDVLRALQYAADNAQRFNIKVVNMSFGAVRARTDENSTDVCVAYEPILKNLYAKGITAVAASGNGSGRLAPETGVPYYTMAPVGCYGVIGVGATIQNDTRVGFSNYGKHLSLSAPGASSPGITSTCTGSTSPNIYNIYCEKIGTSMAAPHVAGVAALMYSQNGTLNNWKVKSILSNAANLDPITAVEADKYPGAGRLNAYKALRATVPNVTEPAPMTVQDIAINFFKANEYSMSATTRIKIIDTGTGQPVETANVVFSIRGPNGQTFILNGFTDSTGNTNVGQNFFGSIQGNYVVNVISVAGSTNTYQTTLTSKTIASTGTNPTATTAPVIPTATRTPTPTLPGPSLTPSPTISIPTPTVTPTTQPGQETLVSQGATVTASNSLSSNTPDKVVDGNTITAWNAGGTAPQWIELNLNQPRTISTLKLIVNQNPTGQTIHRIYAGSSPNPQNLVREISGSTQYGQILTETFSSPLTNIQYIRVMTAQSPSWVAWFEIQAFSPGSIVVPTTPVSSPTPTTVIPTPTRTPTPTTAQGGGTKTCYQACFNTYECGPSAPYCVKLRGSIFSYCSTSPSTVTCTPN